MLDEFSHIFRTLGKIGEISTWYMSGADMIVNIIFIVKIPNLFQQN